MWAVSTHSPFLRKVDDNELEDKSAFEAFASHMIARSMIECVDVLKAEFRTAPYLLLQSFGNHITSLDTATVQELVAVPFYNLLFANSPGLMDYFSKTDMDAQSAHATYVSRTWKTDLLFVEISALTHLGPKLIQIEGRSFRFSNV